MQKKKLEVLKADNKEEYNRNQIHHTFEIRFLTANEGIVNDSTCSRGQNHVSPLRLSGSNNSSRTSARDRRQNATIGQKQFLNMKWKKFVPVNKVDAKR